jgi:hypothetical protein
LLKESERVTRLLGLISAINRTNAKAAFNEKQTISDADAERDVTGKQGVFLSTIAEVASTRRDRYSKSEVKFVLTVSIAQLQKQVDQLAKQFRELDTRLPD